MTEPVKRRTYKSPLRAERARATRRAVVAAAMELFLAVVMGPSQEFVRLWLSGRARSDIKLAKRRLADSAWRAVRPDR